MRTPMNRAYRRILRGKPAIQREEVSEKEYIPQPTQSIRNNIPTSAALCGFCKLENNYLREWITYHKELGFAHIYLYDNNDKDAERVEDILDDTMREYVTVVDFRGKKQKDCKVQCEAYNHCYNKYGSAYKFLCFLDIDEFLTFSKPLTVNQYLNMPRIKDANIIKINWKCFDDNDNLHYEDKPVIERFTRECTDKNQNRFYKSFYRTCIPSFNIVNCHYSNIQKNIVDSDGSPLKYEKRTMMPYVKDNLAYIRHYCTKSVDEYVNIKIFRRSEGISKRRLSKNFYWKYNKKTKEKEAYLNRLLP